MTVSALRSFSERLLPGGESALSVDCIGSLWRALHSDPMLSVTTRNSTPKSGNLICGPESRCFNEPTYLMRVMRGFAAQRRLTCPSGSSAEQQLLSRARVVRWQPTSTRTTTNFVSQVLRLRRGKLVARVLGFPSCLGHEQSRNRQDLLPQRNQ